MTIRVTSKALKYGPPPTFSVFLLQQPEHFETICLFAFRRWGLSDRYSSVPEWPKASAAQGYVLIFVRISLFGLFKELAEPSAENAQCFSSYNCLCLDSPASAAANFTGRLKAFTDLVGFQLSQFLQSINITKHRITYWIFTVNVPQSPTTTHVRNAISCATLDI